ncbi:hypothetical protein ACI2KG_28025 [Pseudomonas sp. NPDC089407]|uniref:hypothetical protein n=1 Tax=Pseudomonas sp. NPDC089407 TaxID=3364464 RepID=UPI003850FFFA
MRRDGLRSSPGNLCICAEILGCWDAGHLGQVWSFQLCQVPGELPAHWSHQTLDDHGHLFDFFWAPLDDLPYADCHPVFQRTLAYLHNALRLVH